MAGAVKSAMTNALQGMEDALVKFVQTGKLNFSDLASNTSTQGILVLTSITGSAVTK